MGKGRDKRRRNASRHKDEARTAKAEPMGGDSFGPYSSVRAPLTPRPSPRSGAISRSLGRMSLSEFCQKRTEHADETCEIAFIDPPYREGRFVVEAPGFDRRTLTVTFLRAPKPAKRRRWLITGARSRMSRRGLLKRVRR